MPLAKAKLQEVSTEPDAKPIGKPLEVQFNPTTLKLQMSNTVEGGESLGRQVRQFVGKSSATLTLDLVFDTADEGTSDQPRSVRERTSQLEDFLKPRAAKGTDKQTPARVRFAWGDLVVTGIIDNLNIDFDLFAANGVPLRAKASLAIKEQDPKWELGEVGAGAGGRQSSVRTTVALDGESLPDLAARVGLDPSGWKKLAGGLESTVSLTAGAAVDFDVGASMSLGLGVTAGVEVGASASLEASLGLDAGVSLGGGATAAGAALGAIGGVSAAIETAKIVRADAAATNARQAFPAGSGSPSAALPPSRVPLRPTPPAMPTPPPMRRTGIPSAAARADAPPAPPPPVADARAVSFGLGVPLRPRSYETASSAVVVGRRATVSVGAVPVTRDRTVAPWLELPVSAPGRDRADRAQRRRRPLHPCGCTGRCGHAGGAT